MIVTPLPPLVVANQEIPRCEITIRLPARWLKIIEWNAGVNIEDAVSTIVCALAPWFASGDCVPCREFSSIWEKWLGDVSIPYDWKAGCVKTRIPIRRDILNCLHVAAATVNRDPYEVLAKILTRGLACQLGSPLPVGRRKAMASNIIQFQPANL